MTILLVLAYGFMIILSALFIYVVFHSHERTLALFGAFGLAAHGLFLVLVSWSGAVARWLGWLGIGAGVLGFLGVLAVVFNVGVGRLMFMSGILLMFGFILILGIRLLVRKTWEAPATAFLNEGD